MEYLLQFSDDNVYHLKKILDKVVGNTFAEIGCWTGHSTSYIAEEAKERVGRCHVIDWFKGDEGTKTEELAGQQDILAEFKGNMHALGLKDNIIIHEGKSEDCADHFAYKSLDFLFVDGGHSYATVKRDLDLYLPKVKPNGIIAGHDFEDVKYDERLIHLDFIGEKHHGVIKAVVEKFGGSRINRLGNIWYVELGAKYGFIERLVRLYENYNKEPHKYKDSTFDERWAEREMK